nr:hypothetical protein CPGR_00237 [Mycolicibacter nonchromogenicus]
MTVTGASPATPTALSVTDAVTLGISRSAKGVPLSVMILTASASALLPHALKLITAAVTVSNAAARVPNPRQRCAKPTCPMLFPPEVLILLAGQSSG